MRRRSVAATGVELCSIAIHVNDQTLFVSLIAGGLIFARLRERDGGSMIQTLTVRIMARIG